MLSEDSGDCLIHVLLQFCTVEIKTTLGKKKIEWGRLGTGGCEVFKHSWHYMNQMMRFYEGSIGV